MDRHSKRLMSEVLKAGALSLRDVDGIFGEKEDPFLYSSGNYGPGYVMIKGLVGRGKLFHSLCLHLAIRVADAVPNLDFATGNATGGMIPTHIVCQYLESMLGRPIPYVYARNMRKAGGHRELFCGLDGNPEISQGARAIVGEELVNFANTTSNSVAALREIGYVVDHAMCILFYGNPKAIAQLKEQGVEMVYLFTLSELLDVAQEGGTHRPGLIDAYRKFLTNPKGWMEERGIEPRKEGGTV